MADIQLKKGLLEVCVLSALSRGDSYGYRIIGDVSSCIEISESTLYPILKRLEGSGCLSTYSQEHNGRLRKYYSIMPEGKRRIDDFLAEWHEMEDVYHFVLEGEKKDE